MSSASERLDVLAIGELNPDLILTGLQDDGPRLGVEQEFGGYRLTLGSSTAISCVLMQRLGLKTALSACVGDDEYGRFCRQALEIEQVDTRLVEVCPGVETGLTICLPYPRDRMLLTCKGAMALNPARAVGVDQLRTAGHLHVGSFFLQTGLRPALAGLFALARALGLTTSLDTGWDPEQTWLTEDLRATLAKTSFFLPNQTEFEHLTGEADAARGAEKLLELGVGAVVLKRGALGAVHVGPEGMFDDPGFATDAIDTTGAGDAFNAGYLTAMMKGQPVSTRLAFGNACGSLTASAIGGTGGVLGPKQVQQLIASRAPLA